MSLLYFPIIVSLFGLAFVWVLAAKSKKKADEKNAALFWEELKRKYKTIGIAALVFFLVLLFLGWKIAIGFLIGAIFATIVDITGALGVMLASLGLLAVSVCYFSLGISGLVGCGIGAGLISLFGSVKNRAAVSIDTFQTYCLVIFANIFLGALLFPRSPQFVLLPLILASVAILALIVAGFFEKFGKNKAIFAGLILSATGFYLVISKLMAGQAVFWFLGFYGVAAAAVMLVSLSGIITHKIYGIILSALAALVLFFAYFLQVISRGVSIYNLDYPKVIAGFLIGAIISSLLVISMGAPKNKKVFFAGLIIILSPILTGFFLGPQALGGLLIGVIVSGALTGFLSAGEELAINSLMKGVCLIGLLIIPFLV